jgi:hypothetical protein
LPVAGYPERLGQTAQRHRFTGSAPVGAMNELLATRRARDRQVDAGRDNPA